MQIGFVHVQISCELSGEILSFIIIKNPNKLVVSCRCRKLPKALKEWEAFNALSKKINDFNESCPLLELMANKAMKDRHWDRIAKCTGHTFDLESDSFALRNIMEADLLPHKEDIEVSYLTDDITVTTSTSMHFFASQIYRKWNIGAKHERARDVMEIDLVLMNITHSDLFDRIFASQPWRKRILRQSWNRLLLIGVLKISRFQTSR